MADLPFTYMPIDAVLQATAVGSRATLYTRIKQGKFPAPDHIGTRARWRSDLIAKWLLEQAAEADAKRAERWARSQAKAAQLVDGRQRQRASAP